MSKSAYLHLADLLAADIAAGRLAPGERLLPQRDFAYDRGIAASTASRVYAELLRRGLVVGEIGRGTFVSGEPRGAVAALGEPRGTRIDLEFNYPMLTGQTALIAGSLAGLEKGAALEAALAPATSRGTPELRAAASAFLAEGGWSPSAGQLLFTGNGRQSIAAALAVAMADGGRCGVETLTYPFIKGAAARLGVTLVPLAMDHEGVRPDAIEKAHREARLAAVYLQPAVQNPIGVTMSAARRAEVARLAGQLEILIIEDRVYSFLEDAPPLAALAPDMCIVIDSLSKRVAPGLTLGFVVPPPWLGDSTAAAVRSGGWTASGFAVAAAERLLGDGTVDELVRRKRLDALARQELARRRLAGFQIEGNAKAYHLWLTLPPHWRSQSLVAAAARRDIALSPSSTFAARPGYAPNAVRLALASPSEDQLDQGLTTLAQMLHGSEDDFDTTE